MVWLRTFVFIAVAALSCQLATAESVLVEFTTQNCGPCRRMQPVVRQLAAEGYAVREVDASSQPQVADQYRVNQFPTFLVLVDGREYARLEGGTGRQQLVEMIHRATAIAAQNASASNANNRGAVALVNSAAAPAGNGGFAQPEPGRVVQLQDPQRPATGGATSANPFANAQAFGPPPVQTVAIQPTAPAMNGAPTPGALSAGAGKLVDSTVRLSVTDAEGKSTGTGTVIDARGGKALVLTCGHLFRESQGRGPIEISLFRAGPQGAEPRGQVEAQLIDYDLERDLALVCFQADPSVAVSPVAPRGTQLSVEAPVTSVGCGHGSDPTPWQSRITAVNRYQGHPNVEAAGAPEEGRSGGGLFNASGQLIGVCFAADPQGNEGLYASLDSIYAKLDALNLTATLQTPPSHLPQQAVESSATQLATAAATSPFEVRGQSAIDAAAPASREQNPFSQALTSIAPGVASAVASAPVDLALPSEERAALQEIGRRSAGGEVIVIIRPQGEAGPSEVIKLNTASPAFVETLEAVARDQGVASARAVSGASLR